MMNILKSMTEKQQIAQIHDIIAGVLIGSIKSYDAAISIHKLASDGVSEDVRISLPSESEVVDIVNDKKEINEQ